MVGFRFGQDKFQVPCQHLLAIFVSTLLGQAWSSGAIDHIVVV
jgi:hypothetical protein